MHACTDVKLLWRHIIGLAIQAPAHDDVATSLCRSGLTPIYVTTIENDLAERYGLRYDQLRGDRGYPRPIRFHSHHVHFFCSFITI